MNNMTLKMAMNFIITHLFTVLILLGCGLAKAQEYIPEPEYSFIDRNNVDVMGGKLSLSTPALSIGSDSLSLSYKIPTYSGDFISARDDYNSPSIYFVRKAYKEGIHFYYVRYMIVRSPAGTIQFTLDDNDNYIGLASAQGSVVERGNRFTVTYPDGTVAKFSRIAGVNDRLADYTQHTDANTIKIIIDSGAAYNEIRVALMDEIEYPNGYTLTLHRDNGVNELSVTSVTTNNGLQVKYTPEVADTSRAIYAINNAYTHCSTSYTQPCDYSGWHSLRFKWSRPDAIQNVINNTPNPFFFEVTDPAGLKTKYHHSPYDDNERADNSLYPLGRSYTWRITEVEQPSGQSMYYTYSNRTESFVSQGRRVVERSVLRSAATDTYTAGYNLENKPTEVPQGGSAQHIIHSGGSYRGINVKYSAPKSTLLTAIDYATYTTYLYNSDWNNEITTVQSPEGIFNYIYDDRKRLIKRVQSDGTSPGIVMETGYPAGCPNPKTCNKPIWFKDPNGNQTDYEYHTPSGQIAKVTKPAGRNGIRPQTRYFYEQKYARYKNSAGTITRASKPIWLLVKESSCQKGAANGNGCADPTDEIVTTYEYGPDSGPNNLFLRGMAVTASGETRRTCYEYDKYGNRVSQTSALGTTALNSCP